MQQRPGELLSVIAFVLVIGGCVSSDGSRAVRIESPSQADERVVAARDDSSPKSAQTDGETAPVNTLRWKTASEVDNFGFEIYRSTDEEGPFERMTREPLPGAGTTDEPQSYVFVDDTIDPTRGYYYYIESISMAGVRERFSPVLHIGPKAPVNEGSE